MARVSIVRDSDDRPRARARAVGIHLDDVAWLRATDGELVELGIAEGTELDEKGRSEVEVRLARVRSRSFVVRSLAVRAQSVAELERKLARRAIPATIAAEAIELARSYGYLDDEVLAGQLARGLRARGYGRRRAEGALRARGIPTGLAEAAIAEAFGAADECDEARRALGRRTIGDSAGDRRRAAAFLVRRGFSASAAWAAVDTARAEQRR